MATAVEEIRALSKPGALRLDGALLVQRGQPLLMSAVRADDLVERSEVDTYDPKTKRGYQRERVTARVRDAAHYYQDERHRMPNPVLLNVREESFANLRVQPVGSDQDGYFAAIENGTNWIGPGFVELPQSVKCWLYDGQHREGGIEQLVESVADFGDFPVPISVTLGLSSLEEMQEFYYVNSNAKSVKTDLAWELLRKMADEDPELAEELEVQKEGLAIRGIRVIEQLLTMDGPWTGSIQPPNLRMLKGDRHTIPQSQFVRSLKPVLESNVLRNASDEDIARVVNAYWTGIAGALPEPFAPENSPKDWVIQKGPGAIAFNRLLPEVIEVLRARGKRLGDAEAYAEVLSRLPELSGEIYDEQGTPRPVEGADFWLAGPAGVASQFTGDAGRKRLAVRIRALLPSATNEIAI